MIADSLRKFSPHLTASNDRTGIFETTRIEQKVVYTAAEINARPYFRNTVGARFFFSSGLRHLVSMYAQKVCNAPGKFHTVERKRAR